MGKIKSFLGFLILITVVLGGALILSISANKWISNETTNIVVHDYEPPEEPSRVQDMEIGEIGYIDSAWVEDGKALDKNATLDNKCTTYTCFKVQRNENGYELWYIGDTWR